MITVWGRASSSNVQCVMWCLAEMNLPHERKDAGLMYGVNKTAEYLAMNPNGTVPTLIDGDGPALWESAAILRYLANTYGSEHIWPQARFQRANVDRWAEWAKLNVQMNFSAPIFWPVIRLAPEQRDEEQINAAIAKFENNLRIAQEQFSRHQYLAGDELTLADIQFGHILYRYFEIDITRADLPGIRRYYDLLTEMPHYREHVMVEFDELRWQPH